MKILILGGMGFVGRNLYHHLSQEHEVTVLDNMDRRLQSPRFAEVYPKPKNLVRTSIFDLAVMKKQVRYHDVIINCAGQTSHPLSMSDPLFDVRVNVEGTIAVLETVRDYNPEALLIYISSSTVTGPQPYDGNFFEFDNVKIIREDPIDIYSANKLAAEKYHDIYRRAYDLRVMVLRLPNLYGPHGKNSPAFGFINYFIGQALEGKPITVYGDGEQLRNIIYINDIFYYIDAVIAHPTVSPIIIGNTVSLRVKDIAREIAWAFGVDVQHIPYPEDRKRLEIGDVKIWSPHAHIDFTSLKDGLEDIKRLIDA